MRGDELEMIDHRVRAVAAERAYDAQHHGLGLRALKLDLALAQIGLDAVELAEKIVVPEGAAKLAVGDRTETDLFLLANDRGDLAVFDRLELVGAHLAALALSSQLFEYSRAQQAADMVGAERRLSAGHGCSRIVGWVSAATGGRILSCF